MGAATPQTILQNAFTTGEMSPATLARQDLKKYSSGLSRCENFLVTPQGGLYRRSGDVFADEVKVSADLGRILNFVASKDQAYVLEFGDKYVRCYTNEGRIENPPGTPVEIVTPYDDTDLDGLSVYQSADFFYLTHDDYPPAAITRTDNLTWNYQVLVFKDGPYLTANDDNTKLLSASGTTGTITITANYAGAFNAQMIGTLVRLEEAVTTKYDPWTSGVCYPANYYVTNAGGVYKCGNGGGAIPAWAASTAYAANTLIQNAGHLYSANGTSNTTAPTFTSGSQTIGSCTYYYLGEVNGTAQQALGQWQNGVSYPAGYYIYWGTHCYVSLNAGTSGNTPPTHISGSASDGAVTWGYIGEKSGARAPVHVAGTESDGNLSWGYLHSGFGIAKITSYTNDTHVAATAISYIPDSVANGGTLHWRMGAWNAANGYPRAVTIYKQRLCFGGTKANPLGVWMSNSGDYYNFAPTDTQTNVLDTNSIFLNIDSNQADRILWFSIQNVLLVGTTGSEFAIGPEFNQKALAPDNVQALPQSHIGSLAVMPRQAGRATLFIDRSGNRLYEFLYNYAVGVDGGYVPKDLTLVSEHILREGGGVVETAFQQEPFNTIWMVRADGVLVGCTYLPDEEIVGWHKHTFSGEVESIACIPGGQNGEDQLWLLIRRTINGQTRRYIEYVAPMFYPKNPQDKTAMWYVECGLSATFDTPQSSIGGLAHLEGQSVVAVVDGSAQPAQIVTGGTIPLSPAGKNVVVGLSYSSILTIMPLDVKGRKGPGQGQLQRVHHVILRLLNSLGFKYGAGNTVTAEQSFRTPSQPMDVSPPLVTDDVKVVIEMGSTRKSVYTIQQDQPYPLNVLGLSSEAVLNED